ncbi:MAG: T9SS type A sorting domain-containing protein [Crocinitomicaceae bacterium]
MKSTFFFLLFFLTLVTSQGQTVFDETFDESDGSTNGTDALGTNWSVTYIYAGNADDYVEVQSGCLESRDTNGPGEWETEDFDISACTEGMTISVDISETGSMEHVDDAGCECNCGDAVKLEISYDGGTSWTAFSDATNGSTDTGVLMDDCGTCGSPSTTYPVPWCGMEFYGPLIGTGDFGSSTFSSCLSVGISNTMRIRMSFLTWAGSEYLCADNVSVVCSSCALPIELNSFDVERNTNDVLLKWKTLSESDHETFHIERSTDGDVFYKIGNVKGTSSTNWNYEFTDQSPLKDKTVYYRLQQEDMNGRSKYSETKVVHYEPASIFYNQGEITIQIPTLSPSSNFTINLYNLSGKLVHTENIQNYSAINYSQSGFYIIEIPEAAVKEKILIP